LQDSMTEITRRDFLSGVAILGAGGLSGSLVRPAVAEPRAVGASRYPPALTGFRGCHPAAAEAAHKAVASLFPDFGPVTGPVEAFDLVVIGAGISGLASAHFYRRQVQRDARILILDIHDDFGGQRLHGRRHRYGLARRGGDQGRLPAGNYFVTACFSELVVDSVHRSKRRSASWSDTITLCGEPGPNAWSSSRVSPVQSHHGT
jgi:hypothetical protein